MQRSSHSRRAMFVSLFEQAGCSSAPWKSSNPFTTTQSDAKCCRNWCRLGLGEARRRGGLPRGMGMTSYQRVLAALGHSEMHKRLPRVELGSTASVTEFGLVPKSRHEGKQSRWGTKPPVEKGTLSRITQAKWPLHTLAESRSPPSRAVPPRHARSKVRVRRVLCPPARRSSQALPQLM